MSIIKIQKSFIIYLKDIKAVYLYMEDYNPNRKGKILIVFDDMIADMISKKPELKVTGLFISNRKLLISFVFISQS